MTVRLRLFCFVATVLRKKETSGCLNMGKKDPWGKKLKTVLGRRVLPEEESPVRVSLGRMRSTAQGRVKGGVWREADEQIWQGETEEL